MMRLLFWLGFYGSRTEWVGIHKVRFFYGFVEEFLVDGLSGSVGFVICW